MAETRGTYHGVDWVIDDDGVLTLGNGDIQTMTGSGGSKWYWYNVKSVVCSGTVVLDSGEDLLFNVFGFVQLGCKQCYRYVGHVY